ncbi:MAG: CGNR zinc finger domain-containing protein [Steroidobacteraceae bacterium]
MRLSKKFAVPVELALLYDFVNSIDLRQYVEKGEQHQSHDELTTPRELEQWLVQRGLLEADSHVSAHAHRIALRLREVVRQFLQLAPQERAKDKQALSRLTEVSSAFPLVLAHSGAGRLTLEPAAGSSPLARVTGELYLLATTERVDRLKTCASEECRWVFLDRSKPGNRRWCSSALCGNRHKTRTYRRRQQAAKI